MTLLRTGVYSLRHASTTSVLFSSQRVRVMSARAYNSHAGSSGSATKPTTGTSNSGTSGLDPDKIKGPGGLTMTQIAKMVQESRAKDLEHMAKKQQQQQQQSSKGSKP
ncbi:hypothetical protein BGZ80_003419 [Entomortierella chlamydospora]|uniref:Uncharacterized protein n=1 Tax=Entomortierella chlamydospora TaxID=101097 RepID=A0A9P6T3D6_9FUNG|nr:hypothetical protein BGZ79_003219 [Entomortierella chlamydospora]KAG0020887.1 hypothetical protein BGZ80_003419 [Entomortierella chlamydospora]